ncbi:MAG TPA: hypothetical protein VM263_04455 [Acidimicrobiales bacterium]|jgi:hypothetical protein|nr:hypothetical protein [Acidimicrobiales bacterium]
MKLFTRCALGAGVVAALLVPAAPGGAGPGGNGPVHSATGSGHHDDVDAATGEVFNRTFSFSAVLFADGTTEGNAQIASRKFDLVIHMRIDCLHVLPDGRTARLSGVVTRTSRPFAEAPVGEVHRFTVQDNGEPGRGVDKFSGVPPNPLARDCDDADFGAPDPSRVAPTRTVERGEIQVR